MADPGPVTAHMAALCRWLLAEGHITPLAQRMILKVAGEEDNR